MAWVRRREARNPAAKNKKRKKKKSYWHCRGFSIIQATLYPGSGLLQIKLKERDQVDKRSR
jgi:hypothetical protein